MRFIALISITLNLIGRENILATQVARLYALLGFIPRLKREGFHRRLSCKTLAAYTAPHLTIRIAWGFPIGS